MSDVRTSLVGRVGLVTIDRPPVNALTLQSYLEITDAFNHFSKNPGAHCVVLTASGVRAFSAGFDFKAFRAESGAEDDPKRPEVLHRMFETIRNFPLPTIAAVNGPAIGSGCVLAGVCDIRLATPAVKFGLPEIDFGRVGGAAYLQRLVPRGTLRRMAFTGSTITAEEAKQLGMLDDIVSDHKLLEAALDLAKSIAQKPREALEAMKSALNKIEDMPTQEGYRTEQERSARLRAQLQAGDS